MGREIKRVALDFDWPLEKVWEGYVNPHYAEQIECPACGGRGYSSEANLLYDQWYGYAPFHPRMTGSTPIAPDDPIVVALAERNIEQMRGALLLSFYGTSDARLAFQRECYRLCEHWNKGWIHHLAQEDVDALVTADRLWDFTRMPRTEEQRAIVKAKVASGHNSWLPEGNGYVPSAAEVNRWSLQGFGHDAINCGVCIKAKCERLGYPLHCAACDGNGTVPNPDLEARIEAWKQTEPPVGEGWQLWETVSEGSPVSPVFATAEELAAFLVSEGYSPQAARAFIEQGWAMSMMGVSGVGLWDGITAAGILKAKEYEHD